MLTFSLCLPKRDEERHSNGARRKDRKKNYDKEEGDKNLERMLYIEEKPGTYSFIKSFLSVFLMFFSIGKTKPTLVFSVLRVLNIWWPMPLFLDIYSIYTVGIQYGG
jgi:hypothetical protein